MRERDRDLFRAIVVVGTTLAAAPGCSSTTPVEADSGVDAPADAPDDAADDAADDAFVAIL